MMKTKAKRVLVLGAGGNSNQVLVPQLIEAGHTVRAADLTKLDYACECIQASVTDPNEMVSCCRDIDVIVHSAGLHDVLPRTPKHPEAYGPFWDVNIYGTHVVYRAALQREVPKIIYLSSQSYYASRGGVVDEAFPATRPARNYYDLSKVISEDIARYFARRHGIQSIVLRPGDFRGLPDPSPEFLIGRLRREDVAQIIRLCLDYEPEGGDCANFEAFNVLAGNPFVADDLPDLENRAMDVIEKYYPGARQLMEQAGKTWEGTKRILSIHRAREKLGYAPQFNFERYLETLGWCPT